MSKTHSTLKTSASERMMQTAQALKQALARFEIAASKAAQLKTRLAHEQAKLFTDQDREGAALTVTRQALTTALEEAQQAAQAMEEAHTVHQAAEQAVLEAESVETKLALEVAEEIYRKALADHHVAYRYAFGEVFQPRDMRPVALEQARAMIYADAQPVAPDSAGQEQAE